MKGVESTWEPKFDYFHVGAEIGCILYCCSYNHHQAVHCQDVRIVIQCISVFFIKHEMAFLCVIIGTTVFTLGNQVQGMEFSTARPVGFTIISFESMRIGASRLHIESKLLIQCTRIIVSMTLTHWRCKWNNCSMVLNSLEWLRRHMPQQRSLSTVQKRWKRKERKQKMLRLRLHPDSRLWNSCRTERQREDSCGCLWRRWSPDLIKKIGSSYTRCRAPRWRPVMWKRWRSVWRNTRAMVISADNISRRSKPLAPPPLLLLLLLRLLFRLRRCRLPLQSPSPPSALHKRSQPWVRNDESGC